MGKRAFKQLSDRDRVLISHLKNRGLSLSEIGKRIGKDKSTISRELRRNAVTVTPEEKLFWFKIRNPRRGRARRAPAFDATLRSQRTPKNVRLLDRRRGSGPPQPKGLGGKPNTPTKEPGNPPLGRSKAQRILESRADLRPFQDRRPGARQSRIRLQPAPPGQEARRPPLSAPKAL
ncbi:MAG TPA: helix-turn-helix domain-containing protein [Bdellovibrionota bacterium]|nr:helix-turn-helix domain-containing protein [Bdellovibrionota bacterium]